jgi:hypothetical protein
MTKMTFSALVVLLAVAAIFVGRTVLAPPVAQAAATSQGLNPNQITTHASKGLASFDDKYQAHIGVLDTLRQ